MGHRKSVAQAAVSFLLLLLCAEATRVQLAISTTNELRQSVSSLESMVDHLMPVRDASTAQNTLSRFSRSPIASQFAATFESSHPLVQMLPSLFVNNPNVTAMLVRSRAAELAVNMLEAFDKLLPVSERASNLAQKPTPESYWGGVSRTMNEKNGDWNKAMTLALGRPDGVIELALLEVADNYNFTDYNAKKITPTTTQVERLLNYDSNGHWVESIDHNRVAFIVLAVFLTIVLVMTIFVAIYNVVDESRKRQFGLVGFCFMFAWIAVALYMILSSLELVAFNQFSLMIYQAATDTLDSAHRGDLVTGLQMSNDKKTLISRLRSQMTGMFSSVSSSLGGSYDTGDVFCTAAYSTNVSYNAYPTGSRIRDYNLRRVADQNTDRDPLSDYVKTLLTQDPYPSASGGVSSREARLLHAISNECEEEGGNIALCCDRSRALSDADFQMRCPGKAIADSGNDNYCNCVEVVTKLGFDVEPDQITMCVKYVAGKMQDVVSGWTGQDISMSTSRDDTSAVYGCTGVYDINVANVSGNVVRKLYKDEALHLDRSSFDVRSMYVVPNPTTDVSTNGRVSLQLSSCMSGPHVIQLLSSNSVADRTISMSLSNVPSFTSTTKLTSSGRVFTTWSEKDVIAYVPVMTAGDQILSITGQIPGIHQVYVCQGTAAYGCVSP
eukprot:c6770_g1_i1.p1 GENE.c6770_g1_i1~~c6770_g1_i1.p1  ORF type:complete len:678 (-),score=196.85 c6770_g1_i1:73-2073(-)